MAFTRPKASQIDFDITNITDPLIRLNSGESGSADKDVGIVIERGSDTNAAIIYDESANQFAVINTDETGTTAGNVTISSYADVKANAFIGALTGNASTATALATARNIGGVSFDGSAAINLPGVNTAGNQNTSGTAAIATAVTVTDNEATNENNVILFGAGAAGSGNIGVEADGNMTYNPSTGKITATGFVGALTGDASGNAGSATILATARNIAGQSFDGSAAITIASTDLSNTSAITLLTSTQTLTNKSLTAPILTGSSSAAGSILFKEDTDNGTNSVTLIGPAATADVTVTLPASAGTVALTSDIASAGISSGNVATFGSGAADDDFLRINGTAIEGRSASEVLSDIGGQASLTFGISNTNAVKVDSTSVADDEYARFTASGLESRSVSEVASDIGAVTLTGTATLTNKSLTDAVLIPTATTAGKLLFKEGTNNGTNAVTLIGPASTADVTVTLPAAADTLVGKATTDTLTNKSIDLANNTLTGSVAEFNSALQSDSFATLANSVTLTNKTLTNPTINAFSGTGNGSITGTLSIVTTTTDDSLLLTTTEDSSSAAPVFTLKRNSSSVADGDYLGQIKFKGENDADQEVIYAKITGKILDASDGTEDGIIEIAHKKAGSNNISARFRSDSLQLINGTQLTVDGTATFNGVTVNSSQTINMGSNRITTVADPTSAQDAATKAYVDAEVAGAGGDSVFSSAADFAAITTTATVTEDLSVVTSSATSSLDLGTISVQGIVTSTAIVDANVTSAKIASSAVTTAKIADDAVTTAKIPDDAITGVKLSGLTNSSSGVVSADGDGTFSVSAGGGLSNVVEDTTPQLGGNLASNGNDIVLADSDKVTFGGGTDISLLWDGTDGHLNVKGTLNVDGADNHVIAKLIDGGAVELYHNNAKKVETTSGGLTVTGSILPEANGTRDLGSASARWQNIYTSDLNLNNGVGNYTVVEGEEDLFLYNNKSGKVFKFALIEVDPSEATPKIEDL